MYESFHGLTRKPFSLLPDPAFLYLGKRHQMAFSLLQYGIQEGYGFVVVTGEIGAGKTTLLQSFLKQVRDDVRTGLITHTHATYGDVIRSVASAFDLTCTGDSQLVYNGFRDFLRSCDAAGKRALLIVDEAQNLSVEALEELRMLSNLNTGSRVLLQIVLSGQPQLLDHLRRPDLQQFVQRIGISYHLKALELPETMAYIRHRVQVAGGDPLLFDDMACTAAHLYAGGIPRLVNVLCDLALVYAYAEDRRRIDFDTIVDVAEARSQGGLSGFHGDAAGKSREQLRTLSWRELSGAAARPAADARQQA